MTGEGEKAAAGTSAAVAAALDQVVLATGGNLANSSNNLTASALIGLNAPTGTLHSSGGTHFMLQTNNGQTISIPCSSGQTILQLQTLGGGGSNSGGGSGNSGGSSVQQQLANVLQQQFNSNSANSLSKYKKEFVL